MAWTSAFNAKFTKDLIRQLLSIVQRDQRAALDFVGGAGLLPDIVSYQLAPATRPNYPAVIIVPTLQAFERNNMEGAIQSAAFLDCVVTIASGVDDQMIIETLQDYVRALDAIFNTLQASTFSDVYQTRNVNVEALGTITAAGLDIGTLKDLFVMRHEYSRMDWMEEQFLVTATLKLQADREET